MADATSATAANRPVSRVLVTGANGFVGRVLCARLAAEGYAVRAAVRGADRAAGIEADVVVVGDLASAAWQAAVSGVDAVVHLAARVHVMRESAAHPLSAFRAANVTPTITLARAAAASGARRFVYVSSIKVNGEATPRSPFRPDDAANPQDPYGVSKWEAEQALGTIAQETGLEVVVVRPPLVYGPRVGGNFLRLLRLVRGRAPLPLGAVDNRRSMVHVENLASALIACATHPRAAGQTYLVSDGEDLSTRVLIERLGESLGVAQRLWPVPPLLLSIVGRITGKSAEVDRLTGSLAVDSSALRTSLGWTPPFSVDEGLRQTAEWFAATEAS